MNLPRAVRIQPGAAESPLTEAQARFNALATDVAQWRTAVAEWQDRLDRFDTAVGPLRRELQDAWREWVLALDAASLQPALSRAEREQLGDAAREAAQALLEADGNDAALAAVLQRHEAAPAPAPADVDTDTPPDAASATDWEARAEAAAAQREQRAASRRAEKLRQRQSHAAREVSQSVRDVYRKLASALHPDREPDAQQRERKTALMQRANQAYEAGNLLALLELQVAAEEVEMAHLASLDERRLRHYITVLQEQLDSLQAETRRLEATFRAAAGAAPGSGLQARKADRLITAEGQRLREDLRLLRGQARLLGDVEATKEWLRQQRKGGFG